MQTERGFKSDRYQKSVPIKVVAYNEKADLIYRNFNAYDIIQFEGVLQEDCVELINL